MEKNESLPAVVEPKEIMSTERARTIAKELMRIVKELNWAKKFGGEKEHLEIDAWQFIAAKEGATASIVATEEINSSTEGFLGFKAIAVLVRDEEELTKATHECTIEEKNWADKPRYALLGMAQTRAMSRVCRNRYSWIARMGGFSGTPADEMEKEFNQPEKKSSSKSQLEKSTSWDVWWQSWANKGYGEEDRKSMNEFIGKRAKETKKSKTDYMLDATANSDAFEKEWKVWVGK